MPEQKRTTDKKLSLYPLSFDAALKGLLETEPPKEKKTPAKQRRKTTENKEQG